jgi:hypothetical protein
LAQVKKRLYFVLLVIGLLLLAVGGWAAQGIRRMTPAFSS